MTTIASTGWLQELEFAIGTARAAATEIARFYDLVPPRSGLKATTRR